MCLRLFDSEEGICSSILTHVYGRTFPLQEVSTRATSKVYLSSNDLLSKRKSLIAFERLIPIMNAMEAES